MWRDGVLGAMVPGDVEEVGLQGEVVRARAGTVTAEMLEKHPEGAEAGA